MFDALKKSMIDAIEEGQLKLGYRDETIRLYYPLESLCALTGKKLDAAQMMRELEAFFTKDEAELGKIEISRRRRPLLPGRRAEGRGVGTCAHESKRLSGGVYRGHWAAWLHDGRAAGSF